MSNVEGYVKICRLGWVPRACTAACDINGTAMGRPAHCGREHARRFACSILYSRHESADEIAAAVAFTRNWQGWLA